MSTDLTTNDEVLKSSICHICSLTLRYSVRNLHSSLALWRGDGRLKNFGSRTSVCFTGSAYLSCNAVTAMM